MRTYPAAIVRTDTGWSITAVTQSGQEVTAHTRRLAAADAAIAELIGAEDHIPIGEIAIDAQVTIGNDQAAHQTAVGVTELKQLAQDLLIASNRLSRSTAQRWRVAGVPLRDIGTLLGISHQRAAVLCAGAQEGGGQQVRRFPTIPSAERLLADITKMSHRGR